ncbi:MAG: hypothetical protein ACON4E_05835 [Flavobacteriales bacterium]
MRRLFVLFLIPLSTFSQFTVEIDKDSILIGDQLKFVLSGSLNDSFPTFKDSIGSAEIMAVKSDSFEHKITQTYTLTIWNEGTFYIPSNVDERFYIDSLAVVVNSIEFPDSVNLSEIQIRDIKPPLHTPITFEEIWPYLLVVLLIALIIYGIMKWLRSKEKVTPLENIEIQKMLPHEIALNKLEQLHALKLWQKGNIKDYYSQLSEIVRFYIEDGLGTAAMEMPTKDIIERLNQKGIDTKTLHNLLNRSDLAKFAKAKPIELENQESYTIAVNFVHKTKPTANDVE